jgi:hypothetical protein
MVIPRIRITKAKYFYDVEWTEKRHTGLPFHRRETFESKKNALQFKKLLQKDFRTEK